MDTETLVTSQMMQGNVPTGASFNISIVDLQKAYLDKCFNANRNNLIRMKYFYINQ